MNSKISRGTSAAFGSVARAAVSVGTPAAIAEEARLATSARFPAGPGRTRAERERAEAYFWGVVRRRALSGQAPAIARLIVEASLASEMAVAGHPFAA
jgi:hypothetical protein